MRHYAHRCANRPFSVSKRIRPLARKLETACYMRYALCSPTDQLPARFRRWLNDVKNAAARPDMQKMLDEFVACVDGCAGNEELDLPGLRTNLIELIAEIRERRPPSHSNLIRLQLLTKARTDAPCWPAWWSWHSNPKLSPGDRGRQSFARDLRQVGPGGFVEQYGYRAGPRAASGLCGGAGPPDIAERRDIASMAQYAARILPSTVDVAFTPSANG